ncbi:MAG: hypothetical protein AAFP76_16755, partial [Bacteroidota bacterium]
TLAVLLASLVFFQGCTVYKGSITLEDAVAQQKKVKVITSDNPKPFEFKKIERVDGEYVGIPKRYSQAENITLKKETITEIKEHDKTMSTIITFSPLAIIVGLGVILFGNSDGGY